MSVNSSSFWHEPIIEEFLAQKGSGWSIFDMLGEGGSAAVWRVATPEGDFALKIYKPQFLAGENAIVEKHRISLQASLCKHSCPDLIQMHEVGFVGESAYIIMDYLPWPSMDAVLGAIPARRFSALLACVARAAKWLGEKGYVHRDIKPANVLVSPDFDRAVLVDLGVLRFADSAESDLTDHGARRPFVATAQYSSPEYLFRTVEPGPDFWLGLTYYQLGAVLHDLLTRTQLFDQEVKTFNKYVLAMAVMSKFPTFALSERDPRLIALATRCLDKSLDSRLRNVSWEDFLAHDNFDAGRAREKLLLREAPMKIDSRLARIAEEHSQLEARLASDIERVLRRICLEEGYPRAIWRTERNCVHVGIEIAGSDSRLAFKCGFILRVHSRESGAELSMLAGIFPGIEAPVDGIKERKLLHVPYEGIGAAADQLQSLLSEELLRAFYKASQIFDGLETSSFPVDLLE